MPYKVLRIARLTFLVLFSSFSKNVGGVCSPLKAPYFGILKGNCDGYGSGICHILCSKGYTSLENSTRTCHRESRKWIPDKRPQCVDRNVRCRPLYPPVNGRFHNECFTYAGARCDLRCHDGYILVGSNHLICLKWTKRWSSIIPKCQRPMCPSIAVPKKGILRKSKKCDRKIGSHCELSCQTGYFLAGSRIRECDATGQWDGEDTSCLKTCSRALSVRNARLHGHCLPGIAGKKCLVSCKNGFRIFNRREFSLTCMPDGEWSTDAPRCSRITCPPMPIIPHGETFGACRPGLYRKLCLFTCTLGYTLHGKESSACMANGKWSVPPPVCKETICLAPFSIRYILDGECNPGVPGKWCKVSCVPTLKVSGKQNVTCTKTGGWSSKFPKCEKREKCDLLKPPPNGFLNDCNQTVGSLCQQSCNPSFLAIGPRHRRCLPSGKWDGKGVKCVKISTLMNSIII